MDTIAVVIFPMVFDCYPAPFAKKTRRGKGSRERYEDTAGMNGEMRTDVSGQSTILSDQKLVMLTLFPHSIRCAQPRFSKTCDKKTGEVRLPKQSGQGSEVAHSSSCISERTRKLARGL